MVCVSQCTRMPCAFPFTGHGAALGDLFIFHWLSACERDGPASETSSAPTSSKMISMIKSIDEVTHLIARITLASNRKFQFWNTCVFVIAFNNRFQYLPNKSMNSYGIPPSLTERIWSQTNTKGEGSASGLTTVITSLKFSKDGLQLIQPNPFDSI